MIKTITEYRPMIFAEMAAEPKKRSARRRQLVVSAGLVTVYVIFAVWLTHDTGFAPWEWQFWTCFGPALVACELAILTSSR